MKTATVLLLAAILSSAGGCTHTLDSTLLDEIRVEPEAATSLCGTHAPGTPHWGLEAYEAGEPTNIMLIDIHLSISPCDRQYSTIWVERNTHLDAGDPCLVVSGQVESHEAETRQVAVFACGFDEDGDWIAETLDSDTTYGCIRFDMQPGETRQFLLHMNPSSKIRTIRVFGSSYMEEPDEPSTPVPESEMVHLTFSRKWLLENNAESSSDLIKITFPASWLQEPPEIPEGEETVELSVPTRLLMDHNESDDPSMITVTFPSDYFDGL